MVVVVVVVSAAASVVAVTTTTTIIVITTTTTISVAAAAAPFIQREYRTHISMCAFSYFPFNLKNATLRTYVAHTHTHKYKEKYIRILIDNYTDTIKCATMHILAY